MQKKKISMGIIGLITLFVLTPVITYAIKTFTELPVITEYNEYYEFAKPGGTGLAIDLFEIVRSLFRYVYVISGQIAGQNMFLGIILGTITLKLALIKVSPVGTTKKVEKTEEEKEEYSKIKQKHDLFFAKKATADQKKLKQLFDSALNKRFQVNQTNMNDGSRRWYVSFISIILVFMVFQALQYGASIGNGKTVTLMSITPDEFGTFAGIKINETMKMTNPIHILFALLYTAIFAAQSYMSAKQQNPNFKLRNVDPEDQAAMTQRTMMFTMPILFLVLMFVSNWVFGMIIYLITSTLFDLIKLSISNRK